MKLSRKKIAVTNRINIIVSFFALFISFGNVFAENNSFITVSGTGYCSYVPDIAKFNIAIDVTKTTASDAYKTHSEINNKILSISNNLKIDKKDVSSKNYSMNPIFHQKYFEEKGLYKNCKAGEICAYRVSSSINIIVRDIDSLGNKIDHFINNGITSLSNFHFTNSEYDKCVEKAKIDALLDAKRKAILYTNKLGVKLGKIYNINETNNFIRPEPYLARSASVSYNDSPDVKFEAGSETITREFKLQYYLD